MSSPTKQRPTTEGAKSGGRLSSAETACAVTAEMIATERSYIHEIRTYLEVLLRPLQRQVSKGDMIITKEEVKVLECHMEQVFLLSRLLLKDLERASSTMGTKSKSKKTIGEVFAEHAEPMRAAYVTFVIMYLPAFALSVRLMKEKQKRKNASCTFAAFMKESADRQRSRVRIRQIADFLILPVQRVPRYRLMLIELWKRTPPSLERDWIKEAVLRISAVATEMNRNLSLAKSERKLMKQKSSHQRLVEQKEGESGRDAFLIEDDEDEDEEIMQRIEGLAEALYRPRPPTLFNLDAVGDDDGENSLMTKEEQLETQGISKGWIAPATVASRGEMFVHAPTSNPLVLLNLVTREVVFEDDVIVMMEKQLKQKLKVARMAAQAEVMSSKTYVQHRQPIPKKIIAASALYNKLMTRLYAPLRPVKPFHPKANDLVVAGPVRGGQTPVLHILECLRRGSVVPLTSLVDRVKWIESDDWDKRPLGETLGSRRRSVKEESEEEDEDEEGKRRSATPRARPRKLGRLVKTNAPNLSEAFGGLLVPCSKSSSPEFKVVAVVRDPADLRLSLYRHLRRIYRKTLSWSRLNQGRSTTDQFQLGMDVIQVQDVDEKDIPDDAVELFDRLFSADSFVSSAIPQYESFLADVVKVVVQLESPQLMVVFYEELLENPREVVSKLAKFTELLDDYPIEERTRLIMEIAQEIESQREFPMRTPLGGNHNKSMGTKTAMVESLGSPFATNATPHRLGCSAQGHLFLSKHSLFKLELAWREAHLSPMYLNYHALRQAVSGPSSASVHQTGASLQAMRVPGEEDLSLGKTSVLTRAVVRMARSASFTLVPPSSRTGSLVGLSKSQPGSSEIFYTGGGGRGSSAATTNSMGRDRSNVAAPAATSSAPPTGEPRRGARGSFSLFGSNASGSRATHLGVNTIFSRQEQTPRSRNNSFDSPNRNRPPRGSNLTQTTIGGSSSVTIGSNQSKLAADHPEVPVKKSSFIVLLKPLALLRRSRSADDRQEDEGRTKLMEQVLSHRKTTKSKRNMLALKVDPDDTSDEEEENKSESEAKQMDSKVQEESYRRAEEQEQLVAKLKASMLQARQKHREKESYNNLVGERM